LAARRASSPGRRPNRRARTGGRSPFLRGVALARPARELGLRPRRFWRRNAMQRTGCRWAADLVVRPANPIRTLSVDHALEWILSSSGKMTNIAIFTWLPRITFGTGMIEETTPPATSENHDMRRSIPLAMLAIALLAIGFSYAHARNPQQTGSKAAPA